MARPKRCRRVGVTPGSSYFKPRGIPLAVLDEVVLSVDELEALRLADLEGFYQELAAGKMGVSRQTFGRIIESAHRKVAEALVRGKALKIEGGAIDIAALKTFSCGNCSHAWQASAEGDAALQCPACQSSHVQGVAKGRGPGRGSGRCSGKIN